MRVIFLTPLGALVAAAALLPLAATVVARRRARRARRALRLERAATRASAVFAVALVAATALVAAAAAQPVLEQRRTVGVRADAEVYVVLDVSRSMLASSGAEGATRFERARSLAVGLRRELDDVAVGVASLTDRVLPHLFPSASEETFEATLLRSVGIERPPPQGSLSQNATSFEALEALATRRLFSPSARRRVAVVLTDGETRPVNERAAARALGRHPRVRTLFVHVWGAEERVFTAGGPEPEYVPVPAAAEILERFAAAVRGRVVRPAELAEAVRSELGEGPVLERDRRVRRRALAPYALLATFLPLGLLLAFRDR